jgi:hypothetical protein
LRLLFPYAVFMGADPVPNGALAPGGAIPAASKNRREGAMIAGFPGHDDETHFDRRSFTRLRAFRRAAEIAIVVSALVLLGLLRSAPHRPPFWSQGLDDGCEHLGRAGAICPQPNPKEAARLELEKACVYLGRAGRRCPGTDD